MSEVKLNFLLMGKTGEGKSATGNTLLKRRAFKTTANVFSETKVVNYCFSQFGNYALLIVDGPGLEDTELSKVEDKTAAVKNMDKALAMCYGGVDAFLYVIRFGSRFTEEDTNTLTSLRKIFGDSFERHVIVVMTYGENFYNEIEEQKCDITFHDWCKQQKGEFRQLYDNCHGRFVLFNNREKDEYKNNEQIQNVVSFAEKLQKDHKRYTSDCFEIAKRERERLIVEQKAPQLQEEFQRHLCLLTAEIEHLCNRPSDELKAKIRDRIKKLRSEIDKEDQGYDILREIRDLISKVEGNLNDAEKLITLTKDLEETRMAKGTWGTIGAVCCVVAGGALAVTLAPVAVVAALGVVVGGVGYFLLSSEEKNIEHKQAEINNRRTQ